MNLRFQPIRYANLIERKRKHATICRASESMGWLMAGHARFSGSDIFIALSFISNPISLILCPIYPSCNHLICILCLKKSSVNNRIWLSVKAMAFSVRFFGKSFNLHDFFCLSWVRDVRVGSKFCQICNKWDKSGTF